MAAARRLVGTRHGVLAACLFGCATRAPAPDGPRHAEPPPSAAAPARAAEVMDIAEVVSRDLKAFRSYRSYARGPVVVVRSHEMGTKVVCGQERDDLIAEMDRILSNAAAMLMPCKRRTPSQLTCSVILNVPSLYVASFNAILRTDDATLTGVALFNSQLPFIDDDASLDEFRTSLVSPVCP